MIDKEHVNRIASLARLHLKEGELNILQKDLGNILDYIGQLEKLDVSQVEATSHVLSLKNVTREDCQQPSLTQQEALKIAVAQYQGSFKVPQVIE